MHLESVNSDNNVHAPLQSYRLRTQPASTIYSIGEVPIPTHRMPSLADPVHPSPADRVAPAAGGVPGFPEAGPQGPHPPPSLATGPGTPRPATPPSSTSYGGGGVGEWMPADLVDHMLGSPRRNELRVGGPCFPPLVSVPTPVLPGPLSAHNGVAPSRWCPLCPAAAQGLGRGPPLSAFPVGGW